MVEIAAARPRRSPRSDLATVESEPEAPRRDRRIVHGPAILVAVIGAIVTASLAGGSLVIHLDNEERLVEERAREAVMVLDARLSQIQSPLSAATILAETTPNTAGFERLMEPLTLGDDAPFVSASLWPLTGTDPRPITVLGEQPAIDPERAAFLAQRARTAADFAVIDLFDTSPPRLGYGITMPSPAARYMVYAEATLPEGRRTEIPSGDAFDELDVALYFGSTEDEQMLMATNVDRLPLQGRRSVQHTRFGDSTLTLVTAAREDLGGGFMHHLPWMILVGGFVITGGAVGLTEHLTRQRRRAEHLAADLEQVAAENRRLYAEQREIAITLQQSLLPDWLPPVKGMQFAVAYEPGEQGVDIGGDWYDVLTVDDDHLLLVVGDVSGRGLRAATVMAALRYAIHAYAVEGHDPPTILTKLSQLLRVDRDGFFATVLCASVDVDGGVLTFANAGHPRPLLVRDGDAAFVDTPVGPPIGVGDGRYESVDVPMNGDGTLLAFTDGLFERRGEIVDDGLERVRAAAGSHHGGLEDLLTALRASSVAQAEDDTALLGMRWSR